MFPGPPQPPQLVLLGHLPAPSVTPSATPSSSTGSSVAIVVVVVIAATVVTCAILILRRSCHHRRLSWSSLSPRCSFSPTVSSPPSSSEPEMQCAAAAAAAGAGASQRANASKPKGGDRTPTVAWVAHPAGVPVKGTEMVASSSVLVPSAPSLPEVERVILELLSLPPAPMKPGASSVCFICSQDFLRTDILLALPVCSHAFHRPCILTWLRRAIPSRCPFCHAPVTVPFRGTTKCAPTFCSDEYDVEAQMPMPVPASPGEEVAAAVGDSRGWLRSSMDRLSGSWRACSSNHATAVVVPVASQLPAGSWSVDSGHLDINSYGILTEMQLPAPPVEEVPEADGGSRGWLRSYLTTLSGSWSGSSGSRFSAAVPLPVLSQSGRSNTDSRSCDREAAAPTPERSSVFDYIRWLAKN